MNRAFAKTDGVGGPPGREVAWPGWPAALRDALASWRWHHTVAALLIGALTLFALGFPFNFVEGPQPVWVSLTYNVLQFGFPLVLAVRLADRAVEAGHRPWRAYGAAVVAVTLLGTFALARALWPLLGVAEGWGLGNDVWLLLNTQLWHGLGVAVYAGWRRRQRLEQRWIEAERVAAERQRALASARLLALQARVEPRLLFDTLKRLQRLQAPGQDPQAADALLQDLIALLRLLLSREGAPGSTLARERDLVQAFGQVSQVPGLLPPRLAWDLGPGTASAAVAPLWLTELLRQFAAICPAGPDPSGTGAADAGSAGPALTLTARLSDPGDGDPADRMVLLGVAWSGAPLHDEVRRSAAAIDLDPLRERLQAVHGPQATLDRGDAGPVLWTARWPAREATP